MESTLIQKSFTVTYIKSSIVVEVIRTVLFFTKDFLTKQNHLTNIQPNI